MCVVNVLVAPCLWGSLCSVLAVCVVFGSASSWQVVGLRAHSVMCVSVFFRGSGVQCL